MTHILYSTSYSYDVFTNYDQYATLGLVDNIVYDVIPAIATAVGETLVNATIFEGQCEALSVLPNGTQILSDDMAFRFISDLGTPGDSCLLTVYPQCKPALSTYMLTHH